MEFYFQSNSVMNSLKCPKSKSLTHCFTELFPIYQKNHWTIRRWDDQTTVPSTHHIISKIVGFLNALLWNFQYFFINLMKQFTLLSGLLIQVRVCHLVGWITGRRPGHRGLQWTSIHVASSTTVCKEIHIFFTNLFFQLNMFQSKKKLSYKDSSQKTLKESWFGNLPISNADPIQ